MSLLSIGFLIFAAVVLFVFFWALRRSPERPSGPAELAIIRWEDRRAVRFWPVIRRSLAQDDFRYLRERGSSALQRAAGRERRRVVLRYLENLQQDFNELLRLATVIAKLSPDVTAVHEWQRFRARVEFAARYRYIRLRLLCHASAFAQLRQLSESVSTLMVQLDSAMKELGEHAALATELNASLHSRGLRSL